MKKLIGVLIALGAAPILAFVTLVPVAADVSVGGANACASANPQPTDPGGSITTALFCTTPSPTPTASGGTGGNNGSGNSGSAASHGSGSAGTASNGGGTTTTLASTTSGSTTPDESMRFDWASNGTSGANTSASGQQPASKGQLTDGLLAFFSGSGGLVFLYSLLVLLVLIGIAATAVAWIRRGHEVPWSERTSRLTYRAKP